MLPDKCQHWYKLITCRSLEVMIKQQEKNLNSRICLPQFRKMSSEWFSDVSKTFDNLYKHGEG